MNTKNKYLNINRIEFIVTDKCTSKCDHCSISISKNKGVIDVNAAVEALELSASLYDIQSIMTFGGEPLLYPEITCQIHRKAYDLNIPKRQIITNAYWTKNKSRTDNIAQMLKNSHVNNILISIDAFHQKYLPFENVQYTIKKLIDLKLEYIALNPCWFDSPEGDNEYDEKTRELLEELSIWGIKTAPGNIMYPDENAIIKFPNKFQRKFNFNDLKCTDIPYTDNPNNITEICFNSDNSISICEGKRYSVQEFFDSYDPNCNTGIKYIIAGGINKLIEEADKQNINCNPAGYFSVCELCRDLRKKMETAAL
jgi:MoaA/NifB/PqqE/SkfB family radical SAM enzyme